MNSKYMKYRLDLEWGDITTVDILRKIPLGKPINEMSEEEIEQMLDDFI